MGDHRKVEIQQDAGTVKENRANRLENMGARSRQLAYPDPWVREIANWVDDSLRRLARPYRRGDQLFPLLPLSRMGIDPWGAPLYIPPAIGGIPGDMINRMDEKMQAMRQEMDSDWLSTHDGLTGWRAMDELKDNYQIGDDGQLHLSMNFDTKDFEPEDIHVTTCDNRLEVQAKKTVKTDTSKSVKQFYRRIDLPASVDQKALQCRLSKDGVLSVDVPVKTPDYQSLTFGEGRRLAVKPSAAGDLCVSGKEGVTEESDGRGGRRVHLEMRLPAEFTGNDVSVGVDQKQLVVRGRSTRDPGRKKEFTESFEVSETLDPMTIKTCVRDGVLVAEAPLPSCSSS